MYFHTVDNQVLSTQGQHDVNLRRLTAVVAVVGAEYPWCSALRAQTNKVQVEGTVILFTIKI